MILSFDFTSCQGEWSVQQRYAFDGRGGLGPTFAYFLAQRTAMDLILWMRRDSVDEFLDLLRLGLLLVCWLVLVLVYLSSSVFRYLKLRRFLSFPISRESSWGCTAWLWAWAGVLFWGMGWVGLKVKLCLGVGWWGRAVVWGCLLLKVMLIIQQGEMEKSIFLLTLLLWASCAFKDCNFTQFDFYSHHSLGRQDELNHTFQILTRKVQLPTVQITIADRLYTLMNVQQNFLYLDSRQTAEVVAQDIIYIKGGRSETTLTFQWTKDKAKGTGTAVCLTDPITFAKLMYLEKGFMNFKVADYTNLSYFSTPCNVTRVDPVPEPNDMLAIATMINDYPNGLRAKLEDQISRYYETTLNASLYDDRMPLENNKVYNWIDPTPSKGSLTINYTLLPTGAHLQKTGLFLNFVTEITEDENWQCGPTVPSSPLDPKIYGGVQQFLSLSIFQNTVRYALEKGQLNTQLNQRNWQSRSFQFFAGDLYDIIPTLAEKYYADQSIEGTCNATAGVRVTIKDKETFGVELQYNCELHIVNTRISSFEVALTLAVKPVAREKQLDFYVVKVDKFAHFRDAGIFVIHDIELANYFLTQSLSRLSQGYVFGSGWELYARDYPRLVLQQGYMLIYDAGNVGDLA